MGKGPEGLGKGPARKIRKGGLSFPPLRFRLLGFAFPRIAAQFFVRGASGRHPAFALAFLARVEDQHPIRGVAADGRTRRDIDVVSDRDRRDQLTVAADLHAIANDGPMLAEAIVVARDRSRANVRFRGNSSQSIQSAALSVVETLESRFLLAGISLSNGVLRIDGETNVDNRIIVSGKNSTPITANLNGQTKTFAKYSVRKIEVVGEIELFARALARLRETRAYTPRIVGVTGTNGKTTTTRLAGLLIERAGTSVAVAGNISPTALDTLREQDLVTRLENGEWALKEKT